MNSMTQSSESIETITVISPDRGHSFRFGEVGGTFKIGGDVTGGQFAVAQLSEIPPHTLAAPLHRHQNEDEYTYVVDGTLGTMAGDEVVEAEPGTWLIKPRREWHTFWNGGETPAHVIEIVSPAGFESYFDEVDQADGDLDKLSQINDRYGIDMDLESVPELCERFGLTFPELGV